MKALLCDALSIWWGIFMSSGGGKKNTERDDTMRQQVLFYCLIVSANALGLNIYTPSASGQAELLKDILQRFD